VKRLVLALLTSRVAEPVFAPFRRRVAVILMLHRFSDGASQVAGHSVERLRRDLEYLRARRFRMLSLAELVESVVGGGGPPDKAVVFTVDDGYADFHHLALPVFAAYDCPVTVFLITGFVDGSIWPWWDKVAYAVGRTSRTGFRITSSAAAIHASWSDASSRAREVQMTVERLKRLSATDRDRAVNAIAAALEVELPRTAPAEHAPLTWEQVRQGARLGVTYGPHSVTHPLLPQVDDAQAEFEIRESWRRLREATHAVAPVFCYPNGAFGTRECNLLAREGLLGAVTTQEGFVAIAAKADPGRSYRLPRFSYPDDGAHFVQIVSGVERAKRAARARLDARRRA
jgi:peptidoglycan/xylan/chitin deacetylase (PgdA/CDA1 family)